MKKIIPLLCLTVLLNGGVCFAEIYNQTYIPSGVVSLQLPPYSKFYDIDSVNVTAKIKNLTKEQEHNLTGAQKEVYKKVRRIEKYIEKKNYAKAIGEDSEFLPTRIQYMNYCLKTNDFNEALSQMLTIQRLNRTENILDKDRVNYKLGMLYYLTRNYSAALNYLTPFENSANPSIDNLWFALSDIYFNLNDFNTSIEYGKKITRNSQNYVGAQELLYNSYYNLKNYKEANALANNLVTIDPSPINYMRLGTTSSDTNTKLANYYRARAIALNNQNYTALNQADIRIATIEQEKIENALRGVTVFVEKPDWNRIANEVGKIVKPEALSARQKEFFDSTNACIAKYKGEELAKCFEHVNRTQEKLTAEVKAEYQREQETRQRELEYQRQRMLIQQQTYYRRMYMDDFFYMRHPYFWGVW